MKPTYDYAADYWRDFCAAVTVSVNRRLRDPGWYAREERRYAAQTLARGGKSAAA